MVAEEFASADGGLASGIAADGLGGGAFPGSLLTTHASALGSVGLVGGDAADAGVGWDCVAVLVFVVVSVIVVSVVSEIVVMVVEFGVDVGCICAGVKMVWKTKTAVRSGSRVRASGRRVLVRFFGKRFLARKERVTTRETG